MNSLKDIVEKATEDLLNANTDEIVVGSPEMIEFLEKHKWKKDKDGCPDCMCEDCPKKQTDCNMMKMINQ